MPERFSYTNALRDVHPAEKIFFSFSLTTISLLVSSTAVHLTVIVIMAAAVLLLARIPLRHYLKIMFGACIFVLLGSAALAYGAIDLKGATVVFFRAIAALACFYFLILTTPAADIFYVLGKIHVPTVIVELMGLMYRFIFLFMDISETMHTAQSSRLGYDGLGNSYRSTGILISSLFRRMFRQADILHTCLEARGFTGELRVMQRGFKSSIANIAAVVAIDIVLIVIGLG